MDTGCVELMLADRTKISINCTAGENEVAGNMVSAGSAALPDLL